MSLKKLIVSTVAAAALATGALAATGAIGTAADITISANKVGDYLLFSNFYANDRGWTTDLRIVNTDTANSVIAKVVVRDGAQSNELIDFILYLTPGDVWSGQLVREGDSLVVKSTDDSMIFGDVTAAEKDGGYSLTVRAEQKGAEEDQTQGYIEVFTAAQPGKALQAALGAAPVDKHDLYKAYITNWNILQWVAARNVLTGQAVIIGDNDNGKLAMTYTATAMENVTGTNVAIGGLNGATIVGADTVLTAMTSYAHCNAVDGFEDALDKIATYAIHYGDKNAIDESALTATFLTKKYRMESAVCPINQLFVYDGAGTLGTDYYSVYTGTPRDMQEHTIVKDINEISGEKEIQETSICRTELCTIGVSNAVGNEGYVTYQFFGSTTGDKANLNVNPFPYDHKLMSVKKVNGTNVTNMISPAYVEPVIRMLK